MSISQDNYTTASRNEHILFLCSWYPNETNPTLGNFVEKHREAANLYRKTTVLAVFSKHQRKTLEYSLSTDRTVFVGYIKKRSGLRKALQFIQQFNALKKGFRMLVKTHGKPALVHLNVAFPLGAFARYLKFRYGIPYVLTEHATGYVSGPNEMPKMAKKIAQWTLKGASHILPVSQELGKTLLQLAPKVQQTVVTNVVDENRFKYFELPKKSGNEKIEFIHISTLHPNKNIFGLIRVIHALSKTHQHFVLRIITDGDAKAANELARELNLLNSFIFFQGTQTTDQIAAAIQSSDALLLFSDLENFPCVIPEAWMCGKPIISTAVNGIPEFVTPETGVLVDRGDETELLHQLKQFISGEITFDSNLIRQYAESNFSYKTIGEQFDRIYQRYMLP